MTLLSKNELSALISGTPPLVENMRDADLQTQPNGVEMTLKQVERLTGAGAVDYDNSKRVIPGSEIIEFDSEGWVTLPQGSYKILLNEIVNIPKNMAAIAKPRSSLLRCGATLETAVWDAGYRGRSECMLVVHNPAGFKVEKNARVMQLLFYHLNTEVAEGYSGRYQNENL